jgi:DNA-binding MarR family transcriptional regulator
MEDTERRLPAIRFLKALCRLQDSCLPQGGVSLCLPVLLAIAEAEVIGEQTTLKALLASVSRSRTGVRHQVKLLSHHNIIVVRRSTDDRRRADIRLTRRGFELLDSLCAGVDALSASHRPRTVQH